MWRRIGTSFTNKYVRGGIKKIKLKNTVSEFIAVFYMYTSVVSMVYII